VSDDDHDDGPSWHYVRGLEERLDALETWRATVEAVSSARKWALPLAVTIGGALLNLLLAMQRHH
jgi:hypothetical protein